MTALQSASIDGLAHGAAVVFSAFAATKQVEELTVSQWADKYRFISGESGSPHAGKWSTALTPYAREIMDCCGVDHPSQRVAFAGSAQSSKSQILLNAIFHCIDTAPRSIMVLTPSLSKAQGWNREQWEPNVEATDQVKLKVLASKSRSGDDSTTFHKRFRSGFLKIVSAATAKELQSSTIGYLALEEPTDYELDVGGRGDPIDQARHRLDAWGDEGKEIAGSTTGEAGACRISAMVAAGDYRLYFMPCPHCGFYHVFDFVNMTEDEGAPVFACPSCGVLIEESHKPAMLAAGVWLRSYEDLEDPEGNPAPDRRGVDPADLPRWRGRSSAGRYPSFHFWQAYSPFRPWRAIWADWQEAKAHPEKMRTFSQQVLAEPFEAAHDRPKADALKEACEARHVLRLSKIAPGRLPDWACVLVGSADVQGDRIEWAAWAFGPGRRMARIDAGVIPIAPEDPRAWAELGRVASLKYEGETLGPIGFDRFGVDTGGHHTAEGYRFALRAGVLALKGKPNDPDALPLTMGSRLKVRGENGKRIGRVALHLVGTHLLKKSIYHGLAQTMMFAADDNAITIPPGVILFEPGATLNAFKQITAEVLITDVVRGRRVTYWDRQPKGAPNEQLDLAVYALAMAIAFGIDRLSAQGWAELFAARSKDPALIDAGPLEAMMIGMPDLEASKPAPRGRPDWAEKMIAINKSKGAD